MIRSTFSATSRSGRDWPERSEGRLRRWRGRRRDAPGPTFWPPTRSGSVRGPGWRHRSSTPGSFRPRGCRTARTFRGSRRSLKCQYWDFFLGTPWFWFLFRQKTWPSIFDRDRLSWFFDCLKSSRTTIHWQKLFIDFYWPTKLEHFRFV